MTATADQIDIATLTDEEFIDLLYQAILRRAPEPAGYQAWLDYLNAHPTDFRTMVNGFVNSIEYRLRFGPGQ